MKINGKEVPLEEIKGNDFHPTAIEHYRKVIDLMRSGKNIKQNLSEIDEIQQNFLCVEKIKTWVFPQDYYKFKETSPSKTIQSENIEYIQLDGSEQWEKELYEEAFRKTAEEYGEESLAYQTITNGINRKNITGSQLFWIANLRRYLPKELETIDFEDMKRIYESETETTNTQERKKLIVENLYTTSHELVLKTKIPNSWRNKKGEVIIRNEFILEDLIKKIQNKNLEYSTQKPLIISNFNLIADANPENKNGLLLNIDNSEFKNEPDFAPKIIYRAKKENEIVRSKEYRIQNKRLELLVGRENGLAKINFALEMIALNQTLQNSSNEGRVILKRKIKEVQ